MDVRRFFFSIVLAYFGLSGSESHAQYRIIELDTLPNGIVSRVFYDQPSINNAGEVVVTASADVIGGPRTATIVWHNGEVLTAQATIAYIQDGPGDSNCGTLLGTLSNQERDRRCRGTLLSYPIINDAGFIVFGHGLRTIPGVGQGRSEYVLADSAGFPAAVPDPTIFMQWGDGPAQTYEFLDTLVQGDWSNTGNGQLVARTRGVCQAGGAFDGAAFLYRADPVSPNSGFGGASIVDPPGAIVVDQCDASTIAVGSRFALQPDGTVALFSGRLGLSAGTRTGLFYTDVNTPPAEPVLVQELDLGSTGTALLSIDINNSGTVAYAGADCDNVPGLDICVKAFDSGAPPAVLSNVFAFDVSISASGRVGFLGIVGGITGLYLWDGNPASSPLPVLQSGDGFPGSRTVNTISWSRNGFNDMHEFAASVNLDPSDPFANELVKISPLPVPGIDFTDPFPPVNDGILNFGDVDAGDTRTGTLTVGNGGGATLNIGIVGTLDTLSAPFAISGNTCDNTSIAPGASCTIDVEFQPTTNGAFADSFAIPSNDPMFPSATIQVLGNGQTPAEPEIEVTDSIPPGDDLALPFGGVEVGQSASADLTVSNVGTATLSLSSVAALDVLMPPFAITADTCSAQFLAPTQSCVITITYSPVDAASSNDTFNLRSDDVDEGDLTIAVSGSGTLAERGELRISPIAVSVGEGDGTVTATVLREGGSTDAVAVDYRTVDGSATAGDDYTTTNGTLTFADGDSAPVTFDVPVLDNADNEPDEQFTIELVNPTGGAALASDSTLTVTIVDDDLPAQFDTEISIRADRPTIAGTGNRFVTWTIDVSNNGPGVATGVQVEANWDPSLSIDATALVPTCDGLEPDCFRDGSGELSETWMVGDIPPEMTFTATVPTMIEPTALGCVPASASLVGDSGGSIPNNDSDTVFVGTGTCADLMVRLSASEFIEADLGKSSERTGSLTLTVEVTNLGPDPAPAVELTVGSEVEYQGLSVSFNPVGTQSCAKRSDDPNRTDEFFDCTLGDLGLTDMNDSQTVAIGASGPNGLTALDGDTFVGKAVFHSAIVSAAGIDDPNLANNSDDARSEFTTDDFTIDGTGGGCFIATAAFGTYWEPNVVTLRQFRDRWLLTNKPGRAFVAWYYRTSPSIAGWIADREWARALVRSVLTPVVHAIRHPYAAFAMLLAVLIAWRRRRALIGGIRCAASRRGSRAR